MSRIDDAENLYEKLFEEDDVLKDDPELKDIMKRYIYGDIYNHGNLDIKMRQLITLAVLTTNMTLDQLEDNVKASLNAGVTPVEIKEAVYQCTPYVGFSKVISALNVVNKIFNEKGIKLPLEGQSTTDEDTRFDKGLEVQINTFGDVIKDGHKNSPKELYHIQKYLSEYCFGDFYTRKGLDGKTRELLTFCIIATLGGCENQLRSHAMGNIALGVTREVLINAITQCQPYIGFPRTLNAINIINEVTK